MTQEAYNELESIKRDVRKIIDELENIADAISSEFVGIGSGRCSESLNSVASKYRKVRKSLMNIDTSKFDEDD